MQYRFGEHCTCGYWKASSSQALSSAESDHNGCMLATQVLATPSAKHTRNAHLQVQGGELLPGLLVVCIHTQVLAQQRGGHRDVPPRRHLRMPGDVSQCCVTAWERS